ncbi:MAG: signal peptide peptidase SppA [Candidatus Zipacnadales bacterium]
MITVPPNNSAPPSSEPPEEQAQSSVAPSDQPSPPSPATPSPATSLPPPDPTAAGTGFGAPPPPPPPQGYRPPPGSPPIGQVGVPPPASTPPRRRPSSGGLTCLIIAIVFLVVIVGGIALLAVAIRTTAPTTVAWTGSSGEAVGVIRITGLITGTGQISPLFGTTTGSESVTAHFRAAAKDRSVKALVVRINSPGGSAAASQEIYQAIQQYKEQTNHPVVASMADVAASGGYYVAAPADKIVALPATLTGSIGVVMETIEYHNLLNKIGVEGNTMVSGRYKDMGSPFRAMREDERKLFQAMIDDVYDQFVTAVAEGRKMDKARVKKLADGRVYTGRQAQKVGLVDQLGTFRDAIKLAAKEAGIQGEPTVKFFGQLTLFDVLFGQTTARLSQNFPPGLLFDARLWPVEQVLSSEPPLPRLE